MLNDKNMNLGGVGSTPKYLNHQLGGYTSNQSASNAMLPTDPLGVQMGQMHLPQSSNGQNYSPVPQSTKRKPPLPSPFMAKLDSHSKLALYNQNAGGLSKQD